MDSSPEKAVQFFFLNENQLRKIIKIIFEGIYTYLYIYKNIFATKLYLNFLKFLNFFFAAYYCYRVLLV